MNARIHLAISLALTLGLCGCATIVKLEPTPTEATSAFRLAGRIDYNGNRDYLPRTLVEETTSDDSSVPTVRYRHDVKYRHSSTMQIWNPLLLFGFRGIGSDVTAVGRLEVLRDTTLIKRYEATCVVKMRRSVWIWGAPSQSELRKEGLIAVRKLIDQQLIDDAKPLEALLQKDASAGARGAPLEVKP